MKRPKRPKLSQSFFGGIIFFFLLSNLKKQITFIEANIRKICQNIFSSYNCTVACHKKNERSRPPSIILSDFNLPYERAEACLD